MVKSISVVFAHSSLSLSLFLSFSLISLPIDLEVASDESRLYVDLHKVLVLSCLLFFEIDCRYRLHLSIKLNLFSIVIKFDIFRPFLFFSSGINLEN